MVCPECGSSGVESLGKRNAQYPVALLAILGPGLAMFHQAQSPLDYRCPTCGLRFARRTRAARIALAAILLFPVVFFLMMVYWAAVSG